MQKSEYENIYRNEETHFYYTSLNNLILSLLKREGLKKGDKILDAGCGTGGMLLKLSKRYMAEGVDISAEALKFCARRKVRVVAGSLDKLPFDKNTFDAVISLDVIYHKHVKDDFGAMSELVRVLKPGGKLILRAPAFNFLRSDHDKVVMTNRRYTGEELKKLAKKAKLEVIQISYLNPSLFFGSLVSKLFLYHPQPPLKLRGGRSYPIGGDTESGIHSSVNKINPAINWLGFVVLSLENLLVRLGLSWPIGRGVILVARK